MLVCLTNYLYRVGQRNGKIWNNSQMLKKIILNTYRGKHKVHKLAGNV